MYRIFFMKSNGMKGAGEKKPDLPPGLFVPGGGGIHPGIVLLIPSHGIIGMQNDGFRIPPADQESGAIGIHAKNEGYEIELPFPGCRSDDLVTCPFFHLNGFGRTHAGNFYGSFPLINLVHIYIVPGTCSDNGGGTARGGQENPYNQEDSNLFHIRKGWQRKPARRQEPRNRP